MAGSLWQGWKRELGVFSGQEWHWDPQPGHISHGMGAVPFSQPGFGTGGISHPSRLKSRREMDPKPSFHSWVARRGFSPCFVVEDSQGFAFCKDLREREKPKKHQAEENLQRE